MKTPIIEDFDPRARERKLGSPLDGMPAIEKPQTKPTTSIPSDRLDRPSTPRPAIAKRPGPKPVKSRTRSFVRRTFDFYEDQIAYLTKVSLEERIAGGDSSMNAMVREAIDAYIEKHRKK